MCKICINVPLSYVYMCDLYNENVYLTMLLLSSLVCIDIDVQ